ncbi:hypothetical protein [Rhizobium grahamii]|nr:hypothetical protein [Rhizobium grahamii]
MKIDVKLIRDQRRLAEMKLSLLAEDHPLREKYIFWISELDQKLRDADN